jgi:hypothetical protein
MKIEIKLDYARIRQIEQAAKAAAAEALEVLYTDLVSSKTMPFDTGDMQNNQTFVESTENGAVLITGSPQSRRLYYHPEYNFQRGKNANAGACWLEPYISGSKNEFVQTEFTEIFRRRAGL